MRVISRGDLNEVDPENAHSALQDSNLFSYLISIKRNYSQIITFLDDLDDSKHALYFKQAANGVPVREAMYIIALTQSMIDSKKEQDEKILENDSIVCENPKCVTHFESTKNKVVVKPYGKYCYYCGKEIK